MNLILVHIGSNLPDYIYDTIKQLRLFFDGDVYLIKNKDTHFQNNYNIITIDCEELYSYSKNLEFNNANKLLSGFWDVTCRRLILIEALMHNLNLNNVFHIENDIVIYNDLNNLQKYVSKFKDCVAINPLGKNYCTAAFIYIDTVNAISYLNKLIIDILANDKYIKLYNNEIDFMNEMIILNYIQKTYSDKIKCFPILPYGNYSDTDTDLLFDPATWGQLIGGTPGGPITADKLQHHWIGLEMYPEQKFKYVWEHDEKNRKCLFVHDGTKKYKLNNLHVHSKNIVGFIS